MTAAGSTSSWGALVSQVIICCVITRPVVVVCSTPLTNTLNFSGTIEPPFTVLRTPAIGFTGA